MDDWVLIQLTHNFKLNPQSSWFFHAVCCANFINQQVKFQIVPPLSSRPNLNLFSIIMSSGGKPLAPQPFIPFPARHPPAALELHAGNSENPLAKKANSREFTIATNANWSTCPRSPNSNPPPLPPPPRVFPNSTRFSRPLLSRYVFLRSVEAACRVPIVCVFFVFTFFFLLPDTQHF